MRPKEYPSSHRELWQRFVNLEPKPRPLDEPEDLSLFWIWAAFVITIVAMLAFAWWYGEPVNRIIPGLRG